MNKIRKSAPEPLARCCTTCPWPRKPSLPTRAVIGEPMEKDGSIACRISKGSLNSARILALLDGSPTEANSRPATAPTDLEADRQLRERINAHALTLPLPPAAVVTDSCLQGDQVCEDLLSVVTVLAKSSGHVYLRDKQPNLAAIRPGRRVVVLIPPQGSLP